MTSVFLKHDDFCPCARFYTQDEFCTCGAVEANKDLGDIVERFGHRLRDIRKAPAGRAALSEEAGE